MRTVTVFATKGKRKVKIESDAKTWGELKGAVSNEGYDLGSLNATESINRNDLAHQDAKLPEGDFTLFLRPSKTKSGVDYSSMGFKELRANLSDADKVALSEQTGKNWTRCSTDDLREYLSNKSGHVEEATQDEVQEVAENAIDTTDNNTARVALVKKLLSDIKENCETDEVCDRTDLVFEELEGLEEAIQAEESPEALAAKKAEEEAELQDKKETEELADEADDLMSGF